MDERWWMSKRNGWMDEVKWCEDDKENMVYSIDYRMIFLQKKLIILVRIKKSVSLSNQIYKVFDM